ncbi:MAG TPA: MarC family protein [Spirochaetota bacterium]|nr:MarC family protein [Spirochaetota bacterium]
MDIVIKSLTDCSLALIALINPISKIFLVSSLHETSSWREIRQILIKSSLVAAVILLTFIFLGNFLLAKFFHIQIYAFKIAGGTVLFMRGLDALNKGLFFELNHKQKLEDMSIVPLASPMIAGPATITAAVSFPAKYGIPVTSASMILAVALNLFIMMAAPFITSHLIKQNIMGALIRITGLIVATIGVQMMLDGLREFIKTL